tara:strand:- start:227 stop:1525 length:1299 start_codon:yes stop_codon:yes gene_type:complete
MSEGLAEHLSEGKNHLWFILTLICTIAFLGFLLGLMIFEYRNNHCVFSGPSACYTNLQNASVADELYQFTLEQVPEKPSGLTGETEALTFEYATEDSTPGTFFVDLIYSDFTEGQAIKYPSNLGTSSGFCVTPEKGVSIYLKYYYENTLEWPNSHNVVEYGVCEYINTIKDGFVFIEPIETDGFAYIVPKISSGGLPSIITSLQGPSNYFQGFTTSSKKGIVPSNNSINYNPMHDFIEAKEKTKQSRGCKNPEKPCVCIDPSSKNLPSCKSNYIAGLGYLIPNATTSEGKPMYTTNCSHTYFPGETVKGPKDTGGAKANYVEQLVASGSNLATSLQNKTGSANGSIPSAGDFENKVPLKINGKKFGGSEELSKWTNSYISSNIFCGSGPSSSPDPMSLITGVGDQRNFTAMAGSCVPNVKIKANGQVLLGFS